MRLRSAVILFTLLGSAIGAAPAIAKDPEAPTLVARAILPADATAPAPFFSLPDQDPAPAPAATQWVGGFSALIAGADENIFLAMPDNGFGNKANSRSFLLRVYRVKPQFETARGGPGTVQILNWIGLRDPDRKIPFEIVNQNTPRRLLTGGDFDIESMRRGPDGPLWFGDEFGPFLLPTDAAARPFLVPDLPALEGNRGGALERDNSRGAEARHKKGFVVNLNRTGPN